MSSNRKSIHFAIFCIFSAPFALAEFGQAAGESWYLSTNQIALRPANRYFASIDVSNDSAEPVYVRSSVDRLTLIRGERVRTKDIDQSLTISPDEFVVPPKSSVSVRVFAKPGIQADATNQSYYVTLEDASRTQALREGSNTGFILAYDFLVAVAPLIDPPPQSKDFQVNQIEGIHYTFSNNSGRHIFVDDAYACINMNQRLVDCQQLLKFPKQSLLPMESLAFESTPDMKFFGFLAYESLNLSGGQRAYIQPVSAKAQTP